MKRLQVMAGYTLLYASRAAMILRLGYMAWLLFRWSLIVMPVDEAARHAAVYWWDQQGALWGYCRWPRPLESVGEP